MKDFSKEVENLMEKAAQATNSVDALNYAQAAAVIANTVAVVKMAINTN